MMWQTTMNPESRKLIQVMQDEQMNTDWMFDIMLGENLAGRKSYIEENGYKFMDMIDVS